MDVRRALSPTVSPPSGPAGLHLPSTPKSRALCLGGFLAPLGWAGLGLGWGGLGTATAPAGHQWANSGRGGGVLPQYLGSPCCPVGGGVWRAGTVTTTTPPGGSHGRPGEAEALPTRRCPPIRGACPVALETSRPGANGERGPLWSGAGGVVRAPEQRASGAGSGTGRDRAEPRWTCWCWGARWAPSGCSTPAWSAWRRRRPRRSATAGSGATSGRRSRTACSAAPGRCSGSASTRGWPRTCWARTGPPLTAWSGSPSGISCRTSLTCCFTRSFASAGSCFSITPW